MRAQKRWVRAGKDKVPLRADTGAAASVTDPATWTDHAAAARSGRGAGLGYVLADGDQVVCIDLDHCLTGGEVAPWARAILDRCPATYVETSRSGTGLHIWGRGTVARGRRIRRADGTALEVYGAGRYIALGERYDQAPTDLADLTEVIDALL